MLLSRALITATTPATTDAVTRYHLSHVQVAQDGTTVTASATNGHLAVVVTQAQTMADKEYPYHGRGLAPYMGAPVCLPAAGLLATLKAAPKKSSVPVLGYVAVGLAGDVVTLTATDLQTGALVAVPQADANFPDLARVTPQRDPETDITFALTVEMLENVLKVAKGINAGQRGANGGGSIEFTLVAKSLINRRALGALLARTRYDNVTADMVVMPCRAEVAR